MAAPHDLVPVSPDELSSVPGFATIRKHSDKFPKRAVSAAELRSRQKRFIKAAPAPTVTQPRPKRVEAVRLTTAQLTKLRAVHDSPAATAELVAQKLHPDQTLGVMYSAIAALEYTKLKAERQRRLKKGEDRARVDAQWAKIVDEARDVFAAGGLKNLTEAGVDRMAKELSRSRANFNAVVDIANSATDVVASGGPEARLRQLRHRDRPPRGLLRRGGGSRHPRTSASDPFRAGTRSTSVRRSACRSGSRCGVRRGRIRSVRAPRPSRSRASPSASGSRCNYRITCCGATAWRVPRTRRSAPASSA